MNSKQYERLHRGKGFIAALDQSGGSTPGALARYGIPESAYHDDRGMRDLVHAMRTRIITSPSFDSGRILGVILFQDTMDREILGHPTVEYLWRDKGMAAFLKIDLGLQPVADGVQVMRDIPDLDATLAHAREKGVFGTKMRSVIQRANPDGIARVMEQQFTLAEQIARTGLVPIIEPEVLVTSPDKADSEALVKREIFRRLAALPAEIKVIFKLTLPDEDNFYQDVMREPHVVRVVALSGGYSRDEAVLALARNHGLIASFSRALTEGLSVEQGEQAFDTDLDRSIQAIYDASIR